jgi:hypothetical protein
MRIMSNRILKAGDVEVEGKFTIELVPVEPGDSKQAPAALVEPQVRILESKSEFSVIEITCSCGEKINLRCDYPPAKAPDTPPKNGRPKATEQAK